MCASFAIKDYNVRGLLDLEQTVIRRSADRRGALGLFTQYREIALVAAEKHVFDFVNSRSRDNRLALHPSGVNA